MSGKVQLRKRSCKNVRSLRSRPDSAARDPAAAGGGGGRAAGQPVSPSFRRRGFARELCVRGNALAGGAPSSRAGRASRTTNPSGGSGPVSCHAQCRGAGRRGPCGGCGGSGPVSCHAVPRRLRPVLRTRIAIPYCTAPSLLYTFRRMGLLEEGAEFLPARPLGGPPAPCYWPTLHISANGVA
jgi:hypothetical protein